MHQLILGLGSNQGNRMGFLTHALEQIGQRVGSIKMASSVYETQPWGFEDESQFLNMVAIVETSLNALAALAELLSIEKELGRTRGSERYSARTIDLDILFFDHQIVNTEALTIPHPHLADRRFVLEPLVEIAPDFRHPVYQLTLQQLLKKCTDEGKVVRVSSAL